MTCFRRAYGLRSARRQLTIGANVSNRLQLDNVITAATPPPPAPTAEHLNVLYYGGQHERPADLGTAVAATPLAIAGPLCGGALLAVTTHNWRTTRSIIRLRAGRVCFAHAPFHKTRRQWRAPAGSNAAADELANFRRRVAHFSTPGHCPLCDRPDACDGPWHLFLECGHPAIRRLRLRLFSSMPHMLKQLLARLHEAHAVSGQPLPRPVQDEQCTELRQLLAGMDWYSADGKHAVFHMLTALPCPIALPTRQTLQHHFLHG